MPEVEKINPDIIVISPGPCTPKETGICPVLIQSLKGKIPILGICLGHQTIGSVFGAKIIKAKQPVHGKVHPVTHNGKGVFKGLKSPLNVTRYHSLVISDENLPDCLEVTARTGDGEIMGILHREYLIEGVQFHPEALLTEHGLDMLGNFLRRARPAGEKSGNDHQRNRDKALKR